VTGLCVTDGGLRVPGKFRRELKNDLHFIKRFGLVGHMANRKIRRPNYLAALRGRIEFLLDVEPGNAMALEGKEILKNAELFNATGDDERAEAFAA